MLYVGLSHVYTFPSPHQVGHTPGRYYSVLIISGKAEKISAATYPRESLPFNPPCIEISSAFFIIGGHSLHSFSLPINKVLRFITGEKY